MDDTLATRWVRGNSDNSDNYPKRPLFGITTPWSLAYFFTTIEGLETVHVYLWVMKDISWATNQFEMAMIFGGLALAWCIPLTAFAVHQGYYLEAYFSVVVTIWLCANFIWMYGETAFQDDDVVGPSSFHCFEVALGMLALYHLVLRPLNVLPVDTHLYPPNGCKMQPRWPLNCYFRSWRDYEHSHVLFWCAKDTSWNRMWVTPWWVAVCFTGLISIDFMVSSFEDGETVSSVTYFAILLWVLGNATWAYGQLYNIDHGYNDDVPPPLFDHNNVETQSGRWLCEWVLISDLGFLLLFNALWCAVTLAGRAGETLRPTSIWQPPAKTAGEEKLEAAMAGAHREDLEEALRVLALSVGEEAVARAVSTAAQARDAQSRDVDAGTRLSPLLQPLPTAGEEDGCRDGGEEAGLKAGVPAGVKDGGARGSGIT